MTSGWRKVPFGEIVHTVSVRGHQIKSGDYASSGPYPVIDQGQKKIVGYTDVSIPIKGPFPLTLFGDHTRIVKLITFPFVVGADGVKLLYPSETDIDPNYLFFLTEHVAQNIPNLGYSRHFRELREVIVVVPPLFEQRKIAEILSTWDQTIETVEKLITGSQAHAKVLMQRLLTGRCRFSEFKNEWKTVSLKDLLASGKVKGKIVPCNDERRGVPYIGSTSFFGQFGSYTDSSKAVLCEPSDILILWDGEYAGKVAIGLRGAVSSTVVRLRVDQEIGNNRFVFYRILFDNPRIRAICEGSGIPHLPGDFEVWYLLSLPCTQEQSKIAENLDNAFEQEDILTRQLALLQKERKVLMQQLLTGKRRVKVEDVVHA